MPEMDLRRYLPKVIELRASGVDESDIIDRLVRLGYEDKDCSKFVKQEISKALSDYVRLGVQAHDIRKINSVVSQISAGAVSETDQVSPENFFHRHYQANVPIVLRSVAASWAATRTWSFDWFRHNFGDLDVEYRADRILSGSHLRVREGVSRKGSMNAFLDIAESAGNSVYLTGGCRTFSIPQLSRLVDDLDGLGSIQTQPCPANQATLWLGGGKTITNFHIDKRNVLLVQIFGSKVVTLVPPSDSDLMYVESGYFSKVLLDQDSTLSDFPLFDKSKKIVVSIGPGDVLFIPVHWWHHVRSLDLSASVSMWNFVWENDYR